MAYGRIIRRGGSSVITAPPYTYTGTVVAVIDDEGNWRLRFLTSGTLVFSQDVIVDMFLVGGGGAGGRGGSSNYGSGGGGGYTAVQSGVVLLAGTSYAVSVAAGAVNTVGSIAGANGGTTTIALAGSVIATALGGYGGAVNGTPAYPRSAGGSGGASHSTTPFGTPGGSNGSTPTNGGTGQGTTTREFHEATGDLYSGGGGGSHNSESRSYGGAGGGGDGGTITPSNNPTAGVANTGGGGGGGASGQAGGSTAGGSGIFILRNHRSA